MKQFEVEDEKEGQEKSGRDGNPRRLAGREQGDLTSNQSDKPGGARNGKSVHHYVVLGREGRAGEFLSDKWLVLSNVEEGVLPRSLHSGPQTARASGRDDKEESA